MGDKPKTEVDLTKLQDRWLNEGDQAAYKEMFSTIVSYSKSIILKMTRGKAYLPPDYVMNQSVDATIKFFDQYTKNPNFRIDYSFHGVLRYKVLECLYGPKIKKQDAIKSLNKLVSNSDNDVEELESLQMKLDMRPYWSSTIDIDDPVHKLYHTESETINTIMTVIRDIYKTDIPIKDIIIVLTSILHTFRKNKNIELFKSVYLDTSQLKDIYEMSLLEIRNRLMEEA